MDGMIVAIKYWLKYVAALLLLILLRPVVIVWEWFMRWMKR